MREEKMEEHPVTCWIYSVAALLLSTSLFFAGEKRYDSVRHGIKKIFSYLLTFAPVLLLIYSLMKVSRMY